MLAQAWVFPQVGKYRSLLGDFSSRTTESVLKIPNKAEVLYPSGHPDKAVGRSRTQARTRDQRNENVKRINLNKRMGYAVLHLEKAKGADSGMSAHIERIIQPKNTDSTRTYLNRELIQFPDGVRNRTAAIQQRLDTAGLKRKIGKNHVQAIRIVLTGTHADIEWIEQTDRLDKWCQNNIDWLHKTYGGDNVVSAMLHMDEETPRIHAAIVPIVQTERKKQKIEQTVKKKYRTKVPTPHLCADEVMSRANLIRYQDTYADQMAAYGLQRGIKDSEAQHISTHDYYRSLIAQGEDLQANITQLLEEQEKARAVIAEAEQAKKDLARIKAEVKTEELKNSTTKTATTPLNGLNSLLGGNKVNRLEKENTQLHREMDVLNE
jgi:Plasmid recombination enzyme.